MRKVARRLGLIVAWAATLGLLLFVTPDDSPMPMDVVGLALIFGCVSTFMVIKVTEK